MQNCGFLFVIAIFNGVYIKIFQVEKLKYFGSKNENSYD